MLWFSTPPVKATTKTNLRVVDTQRSGFEPLPQTQREPALWSRAAMAAASRPLGPHLPPELTLGLQWALQPTWATDDPPFVNRKLSFWVIRVLRDALLCPP